MTPTPEEGPPMPDEPMSLPELIVLSLLETGVKYVIDGATDMLEYIFSGGIKRMAQEILHRRAALERDEANKKQELHDTWDSGHKAGFLDHKKLEEEGSMDPSQWRTNPYE